MSDEGEDVQVTEDDNSDALGDTKEPYNQPENQEK